MSAPEPTAVVSRMAVQTVIAHRETSVRAEGGRRSRRIPEVSEDVYDRLCRLCRLCRFAPFLEQENDVRGDIHISGTGLGR
jgi:hypothetical protein